MRILLRYYRKPGLMRSRFFTLFCSVNSNFMFAVVTEEGQFYLYLYGIRIMLGVDREMSFCLLCHLFW